MSSSTINMVKYFFHAHLKPRKPHQMEKIIALAYRTARDQELYPKAVFIRKLRQNRSGVHEMTKVNGKWQKDPLGYHVTFSYKTKDHLGRETHVSCHGYVDDPENLEFAKATHAERSQTRQRSRTKTKRPSGPNRSTFRKRLKSAMGICRRP